MTDQTDARESERRVSTHVRLPVDLWEHLREEADQRDVSVNFLIVRAITKFLPTLIPVEEFAND